MMSFSILHFNQFSGLRTHAGLSARAKAVLAVLVLAGGVAAAPPAVAEPILTVTGGPNATGNPIEISYDLGALQALPKTSFETTTMWTEGTQTFEGVSLHALLGVLNVTSGTVVAAAINDYRIEIPITEITPDAPIIAYLRNGEDMSIRDKGPLWIVYPYDSDPQYQSEVVFSRSIWQLNRIEIQP